MTTKTIFDIVMPDLPERRQKLESIIASQSNPTFAAQVCADLSPMFYFYSQKSWELLEEPLIVEIVENWLSVQKPLYPDVTKMISWLLLLLQYRRKDEEYKKIYDLIAKYLVTDKRKPKFSRRMLKLIDNPDEKMGVLKLVRDEEISLIDTDINTATQLSMEELIHSDASGLYHDTLETANVNVYEATLTDEIQERMYQDSNTESLIYEQGVPRLESDQRYGEEDKESVALYTEQLKILKKKEEEEGLSDEERQQKAFYQHHVNNGKSRYDYPKSDNAAANMRSGLNNFYKGLIKKIPNPKFGKDFIKESLKIGRKCQWKQQGIANEWLGIGRDGKDLPPRVLNADDMNKALSAMLSGERWAFLEEAHLNELNLVEMTMIRALYETGRQRYYHIPLNEIYQEFEEVCRCDWHAEYLGEKTNLFEMMEKGLKHFGFIE